MIFEKDYIGFNLLDVVELEQANPLTDGVIAGLNIPTGSYATLKGLEDGPTRRQDGTIIAKTSATATVSFQLARTACVDSFFIAGAAGEESDFNNNHYDNRHILYGEIYVGTSLHSLFSPQNRVAVLDNSDTPQLALLVRLAGPVRGDFVGFRLSCGAYRYARISEMGIYAAGAAAEAFPVGVTPVNPGNVDDLPTRNLLVTATKRGGMFIGDSGMIAKTFTSRHPFDALAFRYSTDVVVESYGFRRSLRDGDITYIPAGVEYTRTAKRDKLVVVHLQALTYYSQEIEHYRPTAGQVDFYADAFRELLACWQAKEPAYKHRCAAMLNGIFAQMYRENYTETFDNPKIHAAVQYLKDNYTSPTISVREAARHSNISEVYFRKLFRETYGMSPKQYVILSRIKHAEGLLSTGYYSLQEIAGMCGFNDYKYFSTEYKRIRGISPSQHASRQLEKP